MLISYSLLLLFIFIFGLCIGSFLNVCIYRIPESKSIVSPGSMCPGCGNPIKFYDNIPVLSFILLRAKCRNCSAHIPLRYPAVEMLTGLFALSVFIKFGLSIEAPVYFIFIATLLVITFIDIDHRIIPDLISLPGIVIFFFASLAVPTVSVKDSLLGILAGGGILFIIAELYLRITGKEGMGGGDVKLLAMIGALIGWQGVLFTIFVSSMIGTIIGVIVMMIQGKNLKLAIPFGPFLSVGAVVYVFFGNEFINWYFSF
jgi:leader peptidase (prepilin peptidase) / N-methyltransferase